MNEFKPARVSLESFGVIRVEDENGTVACYRQDSVGMMAMGQHVMYPWNRQWTVHLWIPFGNNPGGVEVLAIADRDGHEPHQLGERL